MNSEFFPSLIHEHRHLRILSAVLLGLLVFLAACPDAMAANELIQVDSASQSKLTQIINGATWGKAFWSSFQTMLNGIFSIFVVKMVRTYIEKFCEVFYDSLFFFLQ